MSLLEKNLTLRVKNDKYFVSAGKVTRTRRLQPARDPTERWEPRPAEGVAGPCARAQRPPGRRSAGLQRVAGAGGGPGRSNGDPSGGSGSGGGPLLGRADWTPRARRAAGARLARSPGHLSAAVYGRRSCAAAAARRAVPSRPAQACDAIGRRPAPGSRPPLLPDAPRPPSLPL